VLAVNEGLKTNKQRFLSLKTLHLSPVTMASNFDRSKYQTHKVQSTAYH
jgi:hypothetical protein